MPAPGKKGLAKFRNSNGKFSIKRFIGKMLHGRYAGVIAKSVATGITNVIGAFVNQWLGVPPEQLHTSISIATWWLIDKLMLHNGLVRAEQVQKDLVERGIHVDVDRWIGGNTVRALKK